MLKMKINKAKEIEIEAVGAISDIISELLLGIKTLKDKMDKCAGETLIETLKKGLDIIDDPDVVFDSEESIDKAVNELVDKALEDDEFLETIMDAMPDELKADFAKRLKKRARKGSSEEKVCEGTCAEK